MSSYPVPFRAASLRARLAALAAAATVTAGIVGALALSFDRASPELWLAPTPELMEMAARCDRYPDRAVRERCKQDVVTARLAVERNAGRFAQR